MAAVVGARARAGRGTTGSRGGRRRRLARRHGAARGGGRAPGWSRSRPGRARRGGPPRAGRGRRRAAPPPSPSATPTASTRRRSSRRLVAPILAGRADYVVGSRFRGTIRRMRPHRRLGNRVLTGVLRLVARRPLTDGQSGYRALSRGGGARRRDRPRLQLRAGADARPAGQGLRLRGGADRLRVPRARALVRAPRALPAPGRPGGPPGAERRARALAPSVLDDVAREAQPGGGPGVVVERRRPRPRQSTAAQAIARAWWALSCTNRPWRPRVSRAGWDGGPARRGAARWSSLPARRMGYALAQAHHLDPGRPRAAVGRTRTRPSAATRPSSSSPAVHSASPASHGISAHSTVRPGGSSPSR